MKKKIKVLVCCHKKDFLVENDVYMPIHVGKANSQLDLHIQGDNTGDNISNKNGVYCELSGLYWAWKNLDADYIGLCHYRRYFSFGNPRLYIRTLKRIKYVIANITAYCITPGVGYPSYPWRRIVDNNDILQNESDAFANKIKQYVCDRPDCKVFALKPVLLGNARNDIFFSMVGGKYHIDTVRIIMQKNYPHVLPFFEKTLIVNKLHYANMIIMEKNIFNEYAQFVFDVLEEHLQCCFREKWCHELTDKCISRLSGYLGELLTNSFILYYADKNPKNITYLSQLQAKEA